MKDGLNVDKLCAVVGAGVMIYCVHKQPKGVPLMLSLKVVATSGKYTKEPWAIYVTAAPKTLKLSSGLTMRYAWCG